MKFERMTPQLTAEYCFDSIEDCITAITTKEQINCLIDLLESTANSDGYSMDKDKAKKLMFERRQELRDEFGDVLA